MGSVGKNAVWQDREIRFDVKLKDLKFAVLNDLFREGEAYIAELEKVKGQKKAAREAGGLGTGKRLKGLAGNTLRDRDKW